MKSKKISYYIIFAIIAAVLAGIFTGCGKKEQEEQVYQDHSTYNFDQTCPAGYDFDLPYKSEKQTKTKSLSSRHGRLTETGKVKLNTEYTTRTGSIRAVSRLWIILINQRSLPIL